MGWFGNKEEESEESKLDKTLDKVQSTLDIVGMIPVLGDVCDLANAGISLARGDFMGAAISLVSMIPGLGAAGPFAKAIAKLPPAALKAITAVMEKFAKLMKTLSKNKIVNGAFDLLDELLDILRKYMPDSIMKKLDDFACSITKRGCFAKGTLVYTPYGLIAIEDIAVGDEVYAQDENTGEFGVKKVTELSVQETYVLYRVTVGDEVIEVTGEHPFWVYGRGFIEASELAVGDEIVRHNKELDQEDSFDLVKISSIEKVLFEELQQVYNFDVADWHSYFVGEYCIFVHNGKCKSNKIKSKKRAIKDAHLPTKGKVRYVPPKDWTPGNQLPKKGKGYLDRFGNVGKRVPLELKDNGKNGMCSYQKLERRKWDGLLEMDLI